MSPLSAPQRLKGVDSMSSQTALAYQEFCRASSGAFVRHDIVSADPEHFRGSITAQQMGPVEVARIGSRDHDVVRTASHVGNTDTSNLKVSLQVHGRALLEQGDTRSVLGPGDFVVYDTARPYSIRFVDNYQTVVLMLPRSLLPVSATGLQLATGRRIEGRGGPHRCFTGLLREVSRGMQDVKTDEADSLADSVVDLLALSLRHELGRSTPQSSAHVLLREQVRSTIDRELANPRLSPAYLAEEHHVSLRHLHAVFRESGVTVAQLIRQRRLERCHADLLDPGLRDLAVTQVASRHGFGDPAHFSRIYRERFGCSPSQSREASR